MRLAASLAFAVAALFGTAAQAQVNVKIGVMNDMSSLYADISGPGAITAAKMAVEDFNPPAHGMKVEIVSADHQNKPHIGADIAREKNKVFLVSGAASSDLTGPKCSPNTVHWTYDTWMLANGTGKALVKTGGDPWFFLTSDYAFGPGLERDTAAAVTAAGG